jgi:hypothetical protein
LLCESNVIPGSEVDKAPADLAMGYEGPQTTDY